MSETWTISAGSRVFGPYSAEQMQIFRDQGRLAPHSLVARTGDDNFRPAGEDQSLGHLFAAPEAPSPEPAKAEQAAKFGRDAENDGEVNRYVIIADMKSGSITGVDEEISKLGPACRLTVQAWILNSEISLNTLRSALTQKLGKLDNLFIVDVSHDKAAWFNFGPETETRLRSLWLRQDQRKAG
jgi:hypothetical protein